MSCKLMKMDLPVYCDVASCHNKAIWSIGNPFAKYNCFNICESCLKELMASVSELIDEKYILKSKVSQTIKYFCRHCGEEFDNPLELSKHIRKCSKVTVSLEAEANV